MQRSLGTKTIRCGILVWGVGAGGVAHVEKRRQWRLEKRSGKQDREIKLTEQVVLKKE